MQNKQTLSARASLIVAIIAVMCLASGCLRKTPTEVATQAANHYFWVFVVSGLYANALTGKAEAVTEMNISHNPIPHSLRPRLPEQSRDALLVLLGGAAKEFSDAQIMPEYACIESKCVLIQRHLTLQSCHALADTILNPVAQRGDRTIPVKVPTPPLKRLARLDVPSLAGAVVGRAPENSNSDVACVAGERPGEVILVVGAELM